MWNPEEYKKKVQPQLDKLLTVLSNKGITLKPSEGKLKNAIFTNGSKELLMSEHSLYRYSGLCSITKENKEKNSLDVIEITDEMWLNNYIKPIIENYFK